METIEKEKALDVVRQMVADGQVSQEVAEKYFPELKESNGERIRQLLMRFVKYEMSDNYSDDFSKEECLAWLEKRSGKCVVLRDTFGYEEGRQKGREEGIMQVLDNPRKYGLEKQCEQNTAWSEEDEKMLNACTELIGNTISANYGEEDGVTIDTCRNWLKSLKGRVQPQPRQEWSENDESRMDNLCHFLEEYGNQYYGYLTLQCTISWIKSLRSKKQWKPSDEQMEALDSATENCAYSEYQDCLRELIGQLKKLREE